MTPTIDKFQDDLGAHLPPSNFYRWPVTIGGLVWPTTEHFYQAMKTTHRGVREEIRQLGSPGAAKRAGQGVTLRDDWEQIKIPVMRTALEAKFTLRNEVGLWLVGSAPALLVEGNHWGDRFWGVCGGEGQNWLGVLLMARRAELLAGMAAR